MIRERTRNRGNGANNYTPLLAVIPTNIFDLDATVTESYGGAGQIWRNLAISPADGSTSFAYNFFLGASATPSTDDPTFTGSAGSSSAYFALDGGDYFNLAANTTFFAGLQRTDLNQPFWFACAFRFKSSGVTQSLIGTSPTTADVGFRLLVNTANVLQFSQRGDTAAILSTSSSTLIDDTDYLVILTSQGNGSNVRFWVNTLTQNDVARTPNTSVTNTSNTVDLAASGAGAARLANGSRVYAYSGGLQYITSTEAAVIASVYYKRHQRSYGIYPQNTAAPSISGTQRLGETLTGSNGTWLGSPSFTYQWLRNGVEIGGATSSTYVITASDLGQTLTIRVTGTANSVSVSSVSAGVTIGNSLLAVLSSAIIDADATMNTSYDGSSQTWVNIVPTPADGSASTDYDFRLGDSSLPSTDDPTFIGTAGSPSAYFSLDGGDEFTLNSATNTAFLDALHKTTGGTNFWLAFVVNLPDLATASVGLSTKTTSSTIGFNVQFAASEHVRFQQTGDATLTTTTSSSDHPALTIGTPTLIIASYSGGTLRSWVNSGTKVERAMAFNVTVSNASGYLSIGSQASGGSSKLPNETRIYAVSMGNGYIDDAQAALIISTYNSRHGRTYA